MSRSAIAIALACLVGLVIVLALAPRFWPGGGTDGISGHGWIAYIAGGVLTLALSGGLFFLWVSTRHREVGLGYGWLLRGVYLLLAVGAALAGFRFGVVPVINELSQSRAPGPCTLNRENPGRSRMPAASRTARHSSRTAPNHEPSRAQVWVASSLVSSPGRAYQLARSQPL